MDTQKDRIERMQEEGREHGRTNPGHEVMIEGTSRWVGWRCPLCGAARKVAI